MAEPWMFTNGYTGHEGLSPETLQPPISLLPIAARLADFLLPYIFWLGAARLLLWLCIDKLDLHKSLYETVQLGRVMVKVIGSPFGYGRAREALSLFKFFMVRMFFQEPFYLGEWLCMLLFLPSSSTWRPVSDWRQDTSAFLDVIRQRLIALLGTVTLVSILAPRSLRPLMRRLNRWYHAVVNTPMIYPRFALLVIPAAMVQQTGAWVSSILSPVSLYAIARTLLLTMRQPNDQGIS